MDVFAGDSCFDSFDSLGRNAIDTALNLVRSHFPASTLVTLKTDEQSPIHAKLECEIPTGTFKLR